MPDSNLNILSGFWNAPGLAGPSFCNELKKLCQLTTVGPEFKSLKSDIPVAPGAPLGPMLKRLECKPDLYLQFYSKPGYFPKDLYRQDISKVQVLYDLHIHLKELSAIAKLFDLVLCPSSKELRELKESGIDGARLLRFAADPKDYHVPYSERRVRRFQIGFAGSLHGHPRLKTRRDFIERVSARFPVEVRHRQVHGRDCANFYNDCKLVLNHAIGGEVNMRIAETLLAGRPLLTPRVEGLEDYIDTEKSAIVYDTEKDLFDKIDYYLQHPDEAEAIARHGQQQALKELTYEARAKELHSILLEFAKTEKKARNEWTREAAQFRYWLFQYPGTAFEHAAKRASELMPGFPGRLARFAASACVHLLRLASKVRGTTAFEEDQK